MSILDPLESEIAAAEAKIKADWEAFKNKAVIAGGCLLGVVFIILIKSCF
jgi:hypothetical protein